jgi:orotidine-5'-phosphate decarboxylase
LAGDGAGADTSSPGEESPTGGPRSAAEQAGAAVAAHCRSLIERAGPHCVAVKPQLACFERLGAPGWAALAETVKAAQDAGLLVIADGKRGDVPVTAAAYAQALVGETPTPWGPVPGLGADAFTANPLLGRDALEPLLAAAAATGAGIFALVRTSNPGAADLMDLPAPEQPLHERLAAIVAEAAPRLAGESGLSGMGAVVGATEPRHFARMRELMPDSVFLIPGVGAQGGDPSLLGAAFAAGPAAGLVAASRSIAGAEDPAAAAEELRGIVWKTSSD